MIADHVHGTNWGSEPFFLSIISVSLTYIVREKGTLWYSDHRHWLSRSRDRVHNNYLFWHGVYCVLYYCTSLLFCVAREKEVFISDPNYWVHLIILEDGTTQYIIMSDNNMNVEWCSQQTSWGPRKMYVMQSTVRYWYSHFLTRSKGEVEEQQRPSNHRYDDDVYHIISIIDFHRLRQKIKFIMGTQNHQFSNISDSSYFDDKIDHFTLKVMEKRFFKYFTKTLAHQLWLFQQK